MYFLRGFSNELAKTAGPSLGRLARAARLARRGNEAAKGARGLSLGKGALLTGGVGAASAAGGAAAGKKRGERKGYEQGTADVGEIAERARLIGRREGILAYHQALQAKLRGA